MLKPWAQITFELLVRVVAVTIAVVGLCEPGCPRQAGLTEASYRISSDC